MSMPAQDAQLASDNNTYPQQQNFPSKLEFVQAVKSWRQAQDGIKSDFKRNLADEYLSFIEDLDKRYRVDERVFDLAWDEQHASGYEAVEDYYAHLADIVLLALELVRSES